MQKEYAAMHAELSYGETTTFRGILIDTCANKSSVISPSQYRAYCETFQVPCNILKQNIRSLKGIGGKSVSIGTATIPVPFKDLNLVIDVTFQILDSNVPTLLSMKDMHDNGLDISIQDKVVKYKHLLQPLAFENYFLVHRWQPGDVAYSLYTESELRKLHRVFGHPSASALVNLLKRADPQKMRKEVKESISELTKACVVCAENASRPRRFKFTVGSDELRFNHTVAVDIMHLANRSVVHVVDEATHYNAALFIPSHKSSDVWKAVLRCWTRVYLGPPDSCALT